MLDLILSDTFCARSAFDNLENPPAIIRAAYDDDEDDDSLDGSLDDSLDDSLDLDPPCADCDDDCWIDGECDCPCHDDGDDDDDPDNEDVDE